MTTHTPASRQAGGRNGPARRSAVSDTIRRLRKRALAATDGAFLGSEDELLAALNVSRPTLRQAARVLEHEQLIVTRRGPRGGVYAARPDADLVVQAPALFLRLNAATLEDSAEVNALLEPLTARLAARRATPSQREALLAWSGGLGPAEPMTGLDVARAEAELVRMVVGMSGNPMLMLFLDITFTFGELGKHPPVIAHLEARRVEIVNLMRRTAQAVAEANADLAELITKERCLVIRGWPRTTDREA